MTEILVPVVMIYCFAAFLVGSFTYLEHDLDYGLGVGLLWPYFAVVYVVRSIRVALKKF